MQLLTIYLNTLKNMNRIIRASVRRWLWLPRDTPIGYFYSDLRDGGLGIKRLQLFVLLRRCLRTKKILTSSSGVVQEITSGLGFITKLKAISRSIKAKAAWRERLYQSCDGSGLVNMRESMASTKWLHFPERIFPSLFIRAIKLRRGLPPKKVRTL